LIVQAKL